MICNGEVTIYHKELDKTTKLEKWTRYNYKNVWFFSGKGAIINNGYDNSDNVTVRLSYKKNQNLNFSNFSVGDIVVKGNLTINIETQDDLKDYEIFNITSIKNNEFGNNPHIHIGGK